MARNVRVWTWDRGDRVVDMDGPPELLGPILETVLNGALWRELGKFPPETLARGAAAHDPPRLARRADPDA